MDDASEDIPTLNVAIRRPRDRGYRAMLIYALVWSAMIVEIDVLGEECCHINVC
jgi:hypothetical protein